MTHFLTKEEFRYRPQYQWETCEEFNGGFYCMENMEIYWKNLECVLGRQENLDIPPDQAMWGMVGANNYDPTQPQCTREGYYVNGPLWMMVPTPEYNVDGTLAMDSGPADKKKWDDYMVQTLSCIVENADYDKQRSKNYFACSLQEQSYSGYFDSDYNYDYAYHRIGKHASHCIQNSG